MKNLKTLFLFVILIFAVHQTDAKDFDVGVDNQEIIQPLFDVVAVINLNFDNVVVERSFYPVVNMTKIMNEKPCLFLYRIQKPDLLFASSGGMPNWNEKSGNDNISIYEITPKAPITIKNLSLFYNIGESTL